MSDHTFIKKTFSVQGMSCAACAARVEKTLRRTEGVLTASVNLAACTATVEYQSSRCTVQTLQQAVADAGYSLLTDTGPDEAADALRLQEYRKLKSRTFRAVALALPVAVIGMFFMHLPHAPLIMAILTTPIVCGPGRGFFIKAAGQLQHGSANMDTLVALSTGIAYLFSLLNLCFPQFWTERGIEPHVYFEAAGVIIAFILLGRTLEARAKTKTSDAIRKLMQLQPSTVTVRRDGREQTIAVSRVMTGDILCVRPGERIAVDGVLTEGASFVDESMLNGEPMAVRKEAGCKVFAGTINQKGSFCFRAEKVGADTMLAHIIHLVQEAQGSKMPVQQLTDRIAAVFVPVIMSIALLTFFLWLTLDPANGLTHGLSAAVTVLIIACPCALGLATPTAIMVGIGKGARLGILIKDAESLETARKVDTVIVDKTGTLTEGKPVVTDEVWESPDTHLKHLLCRMEKLSEHPLAEAITQHYTQICSADEVSASERQPEHFESITGMGIRAKLDGRMFYAGNRSLLSLHNIALPPRLYEQAECFAQDAKTVIWFADESQALAVIAVTDRVKKSSVQAIRDLKHRGIEVIMLTGDNESTAQAIARQTGIVHFKANMLPQQKAAFIRELQTQKRCVAMVGDGINDSAALAQANLSIAMGQGSDIAMDVAKITIISSDLTKIADAIHLSEHTVRTIRQNLLWAFIYNLLGVPLAAGVLYPLNGFLLNPMIAGAAMAFSSVSVVANSLRLNRIRISQASPKTEEAITAARSVKSEPAAVVRTYRIEGMMCNHCRMRVEKALNTIRGAEASVSLNPPVATLTFHQEVPTAGELQNILTEQAGDYSIFEN